MTSIVASVGAIACCLIYRFFLSPVAKSTRSLPIPVRVPLCAVFVGASVLGTLASGFHIWQAWIISGAIVALLSWKQGSADYDISRPIRPQQVVRRYMLICAAVSLVIPPVAFIWLLIITKRLPGWKHHSMLALRCIKVMTAWWLLIVPAYVSGWITDVTARLCLFILILAVVGSHYFKPALSKIRLGTTPLAWVRQNRLGDLSAAAYSWGWASFVSRERWAQQVRVLNILSPALNTLALSVELSGALLGFNSIASVIFLTSIALFNIVVALASGILFWENVMVVLIIAIVVFLTPQSETHFDAVSGSAVAALSVAAALGWLWKPWPLGWWDTPYAVRMRWYVTLLDGRVFELRNNFLDPYEREYGRHYGYFLCDEPICTFHVGGVFDQDVRDAIRAAGADRSRLDEVRAKYGSSQKSLLETSEHDDYMRDFFKALNAGVRKGPLQGRWRALKAPGGQLFYWGSDARYAGEKFVTKVEVHFCTASYSASAGLVQLSSQPVHVVYI